jgi:hypothetical protein
MAFSIKVFGLSAADKQQLNRIEAKLDAILAQEKQYTMTLAQLKAQVDKNSSVEESAVTLIKGIAAQLAAALANQDDPNAIQALSDELTASANDLAAAVTANTPPAPTTTQAPPAPAGS